MGLELGFGIGEWTLILLVYLVPATAYVLYRFDKHRGDGYVSIGGRR